MELALILAIGALAGGGVAAWLWPPAGAGRTTALSLGAAIAVAVGAAAALAPAPTPGVERFQPTDATRSARPDYASSSTCRACHPGEYNSWWNTYHRRMTQPVRADNIVGAFDGQELHWEGRRYRVFKDRERFMVDMPAFGQDGSGPDERWRRPVVMTTGSHHMQAYWIWAGTPATEQEHEGQALFGLYCAKCHGPGGRGGEGPELLGAGLNATDVGKYMKWAEHGHSDPSVVMLFDEVEPLDLDDEGRPASSAERPEAPKPMAIASSSPDGRAAPDTPPQGESSKGEPSKEEPSKEEPSKEEPSKEKEWRPPDLSAVQRAAIQAFTSRIQFDGRLTQFPFVWITEAQRWIHEDVSFLQPSYASTEVEPPGDRWEQACDQCHAVAPTYRFNDEDLTASSAAVDLGIACEACHGPGRLHVEHHRAPQARYLTDVDPDDIVNPSKLDARASRHVCGQCHAETEPADGPSTYVPGGDFERDYHIVQVPRPGETPPRWLTQALEDDPDRLRGSFWRDGTVRVAGRDLNGVMRSACATRGPMTCLDCHQMHGKEPDAQLKPGMDGDKACLQCHETVEGVNLAVDVALHTHHEANSEGSRCQNCHMPYTTYGLLQAIRSHRVDSPDPMRTATTGRPDACTLCHLDKSLTWAEQTLAQQQRRPARAMPPPHDALPMSVVHLTRGDAVQRAVTAWHLRWPPAREVSGAPAWTVPLLVPLLDDDYAAVRYLAGEALTAIPGYTELDYDFVGSVEAREAIQKAAAARFEGAAPELKVLAAERLGRTAAESFAARVAELSVERDDDAILINE